ncbi:MAG: hypothetical protein ACYTFG_13035, partial [Planctomycetota bacterium]
SAEFDVRQGRYELKAPAAKTEMERKYEELLESRYGVVHGRAESCCPTSNERAFMEGYNSVTREAVLAKFGRDVFEECLKEAGEGEEKAIGDMGCDCSPGEE